MQGTTSAANTKRMMITIITMAVSLFCVLVSALVCSLVLSRKEDTLSDLQAKKASLQLLREQLERQIQQEEYDIHVSEQNFTQLLDQRNTLASSIKTTEQNTEKVIRSDESSVAKAQLLVGTSAALNIISAIDVVKKHNTMSELETHRTDSTTELHNITTQLTKLSYGLLAEMLSVYYKNIVRKKYIYQASFDTFNYTVMHKAVCRYSGFASVMIMITATTGQKLGAFFRLANPCNKLSVPSGSAFSFSINNVGTAHQNRESVVLEDDPSWLVNIGEGEIVVYENRTAKVNPGVTFDIPSDFDPNTFYYPEKEFTVDDLEIYLVIFSGL